MSSVALYAKAIVGSIIAALTAVATGLADEELTRAETVVAVIAFFTALGTVWAVPNKTSSMTVALDQSAQHEEGP